MCYKILGGGNIPADDYDQSDYVEAVLPEVIVVLNIRSTPREDMGDDL